GGDVLVGFGEAFFGDGEMVHEGEAEVVFFGGKVDFEEAAAELAGGLPANLAANAGFVTCGVDGFEFAHEMEQSGFEEVQIFCASGEESAEGELGAFSFV